MKRDFLAGLGLEKDAIDQIMAENGKDIEAMKSQRDALKAEMDGVSDKLKQFDGIDITELKGKIDALSGELEQTKQAHAAEIEQRDFDRSFDVVLAGSGARNTKAVRALLDIDALRKSQNRDADIKAALEAIKESEPYLFGEGAPTKIVSTGAEHKDETAKGSASDIMNDLLRGK